MTEENLMYRVDFEQLETDADNADEAVTNCVGNIFVIDEATGTSTAAGRIELRFIDADASDWSIFDLLDCEMAISEEISLTRRKDSSRAIDNLMELDTDFDKGTFLVIDRLEILPAFRGYDLGLRTIDEAIEQLGNGCRWVLLMPFPASAESGDVEDAPTVPPGGLQLEMFTRTPGGWLESLRLNEFPADPRAAVCALKRYYARGEFISLRGSALMVRHLGTQTVAPSLENEESDPAEHDGELVEFEAGIDVEAGSDIASYEDLARSAA